MISNGAENRSIVLYIEDDFNSQRLVKRVLERNGYRVFTANDGLKGLTVAQECNPDLILIDINLPNMDGHEITTRLRSIPTTATVPIVAITANVSSLNRDLALAAGCTGFLTKPIDVRLFPNQIDAFLSGHSESMSDAKRSEALTIHAQRIVERLENKIHEMEQANHKLRQLDQMKNDFIVLISHELRTPINLITGYTHLLDQLAINPDDVDDPNYLAGLVRGLKEGVFRMEDLVTEVISVANISGEMLDLQFAWVSLNSLLTNIVNSLDTVLESRNLTIQLSKDMATMPAIEGDQQQLQVAFNNIIGNAIKYTPDGGKILIKGEQLSTMIHLWIQDSGIGIPIEEQSRIFEQFYSLHPIEYHSSSKYAYLGGGLGLGLAIAKGVIEAHGGRISVDSSGEDKKLLPGSAFHIFLPVKRADGI